MRGVQHAHEAAVAELTQKYEARLASLSGDSETKIAGGQAKGTQMFAADMQTAGPVLQHACRPGSHGAGCSALMWLQRSQLTHYQPTTQPACRHDGPH